MKKWLCLILFVQACAYNPVIDSAGQSGTFTESKSVEITNDLQHCKMIAKDNSSFISNILYWSVSENLDTKYEALYRKCLNNRGHSVLN